MLLPLAQSIDLNGIFCKACLTYKAHWPVLQMLLKLLDITVSPKNLMISLCGSVVDESQLYDQREYFKLI